MLKIQLYITGINYILKHIQIEKFQILLFYCIFYQINAALMSMRDKKKLYCGAQCLFIYSFK